MIGKEILGLLIIFLTLAIADRFFPRKDVFFDNRISLGHTLISLKNSASLQKGDYEVVFGGDSSVLVGVDVNNISSEIGKKVYNLGTYGNVSFAGYYFLVNQFIQNNPDLQLIIMSVSPLCMGLNLRKSVLSIFKYTSWNIPEVNQNRYTLFPNFQKINISIRGEFLYNPLKRLWVGLNTDQLLATIKKNNGYLPHPVTYKWNSKTKFPNWFIDPFQKKYFAALIDACKRNNIKLIFLMSPMPQSEYDYHNQRGNIQKLEKELKEFQASHKWLELVNPIIITYPDSLFASHTHLNPKGSAVYTDYLSGRLKAYFLNGFFDSTLITSN